MKNKLQLTWSVSKRDLLIYSWRCAPNCALCFWLQTCGYMSQWNSMRARGLTGMLPKGNETPLHRHGNAVIDLTRHVRLLASSDSEFWFKIFRVDILFGRLPNRGFNIHFCPSGVDERQVDEWKKKLKRVCEEAIQKALLRHDRQPFNLDWRPLKRPQIPDALCLPRCTQSSVLSFTSTDFSLLFSSAQTPSSFSCTSCAKCAGRAQLRSVWSRNKQIRITAWHERTHPGKFLCSLPLRRGHFLHWCTVKPTGGNVTGQPESIPFRRKSLWIKKRISCMTPGINHFIHNRNTGE